MVNVNVRTHPGCSKGRLSYYQVLPHFKGSGQLFRVFGMAPEASTPRTSSSLV
ncbi:hypothetical protein [Neomoorella thermoacetica]|uniref:hypothetical protein n=1 Tax=Neomoorella thermoacetica TaxID=1525 RepID=UPI00091B3CB7|nr:hypothetical protein [Moorella thermoacetica]OIQ56427.1 hypothetical protein MORE_02930 [Moorella thermoacetica]